MRIERIAGKKETQATEEDYSLISEKILKYKGKTGITIPVLQTIQKAFGYLPKNILKQTSIDLRIPLNELYGVASFYSQFRFTPVGKNMIMVCKGTACHVKGAEKILDEISRKIGIKDGETSTDMEYTLEGVACIGCCALAPCITINNEVHGRLNTKSIDKIFKSKKAEGKNQ